jgi:hypothetical protein
MARFRRNVDGQQSPSRRDLSSKLAAQNFADARDAAIANRQMLLEFIDNGFEEGAAVVDVQWRGRVLNDLKLVVGKMKSFWLPRCF